jgi:uncharacterized protein YfiM (DUF2279 family)
MATHAAESTGRRSFSRKALIGVAVLAVAAAAVAIAVSGDAPGGVDTGPGSAVVGMGPGISVSDALASTLDQPLLVNGFLYVAADGTVYLSDALAESYPPSIDLSQSLEVVGLDLEGVAGRQNAQGVTWTDAPIQVAGEVSGATITVAGDTSA